VLYIRETLDWKTDILCCIKRVKCTLVP
jgi:hypothetical protein